MNTGYETAATVVKGEGAYRIWDMGSMHTRFEKVATSDSREESGVRNMGEVI